MRNEEWWWRRKTIIKRRQVLYYATRTIIKKGGIGALYELCAPSATPHFSLLTPHYVDRRSKKTRNYTNFPFSTHVWPISTFASSVSPTLTPS